MRWRPAAVYGAFAGILVLVLVAVLYLSGVKIFMSDAEKCKNRCPIYVETGDPIEDLKALDERLRCLIACDD